MYGIELSLEEGTEIIAQYITSNLDDEDLSKIDVKRNGPENCEIVSEPITVTVAFTTVSMAAIVVICRLIERWIETRRQKESLRIIASVSLKNTEAGKILAQTVDKFSDVSINYKLLNKKDLS